MATARKLPSGSWRVRVFSHRDQSGKKVYRSFTASTKTKCESMAVDWSQNRAMYGQRTTMLLKQAAEEYIADRKNSLSPYTVKSYGSYIRNHTPDLMAMQVDRITPADIQRSINREAKKYSPKHIRNIHGFISAVLSVYRPEMALHTNLPQKKAPELYVPSDEELQVLMDLAKGTSLEMPILLAAFGPMRRGEISALRAENISGNTVHVCENMVKDGKNWIIKQPKTLAGDRYIEYPDFVAKHWKGKKTGRLVELCPDTITKDFILLIRDAGIPKFRFHDLRHYSASIQHALGVPDAYIMKRGGWKSEATLNNVYRHAMDQQMKKENKRINDYFSKKYDTKYDTKMKKAAK